MMGSLMLSLSLLHKSQILTKGKASGAATRPNDLGDAMAIETTHLLRDLLYAHLCCIPTVCEVNSVKHTPFAALYLI